MKQTLTCLFLLGWVLGFSESIAQTSVLPVFVPEKSPVPAPLPKKHARQQPNFANYSGCILPLSLELTDQSLVSFSNDRDKSAKVLLTSSDAGALSLYFSDFWLSPNAFLSVYNHRNKQLLATYTYEHNPAKGLFATHYFHTDTIELFYYQPAYDTQPSRLRIKELGHGYKNAVYYQTAGSCNVNVNCSEGNGKTLQRDATVHILGRQGAFQKLATGTMINTTTPSCKPYILTAMHAAWDGTNLATTADLSQWVFFFNYQTPACNTPATQPNSQSITGGLLRAFSNDAGGDTGSDFLLLELTSLPPSAWQVYYAGWDRNTTISNTGYSIHHPSGDVKKISTYNFTPVSTSWGGTTPNTHWEFIWAATTNGHGVTESGSSGSALFSPNGLLVGTLTGGYSSCNFRTSPDDYGKFSYHWASNGNSSLYRLKDWLDPTNTNAVTITGTYNPCFSNTENVGVVSVLAPSSTSAVCQTTVSPSIILKNFSTTTVTTATIGYRVNNNPIQTYTFNGLLSFNQTATLSLPSVSVNTGSAYTITVFSSLPNNNPDVNTSNDTLISTVAYQPITANVSITNPVCFNTSTGSATISVSGGTNTYVYNIGTGAQTQNTFSNLSAGNYVLTITDTENCSLVRSFTITNPSNLILALANRTNVSCFGGANGSLTLNGFNGQTPYTYNIGTGAQTQNTFSNLSASLYSVTLTDNNNCTVSQNFSISQPSALAVGINTQTNLSCYQSNDGVLIFTPTGGQTPYRYNIGAGVQNSNYFGGLSAGGYVLTITDNNNCTITRSVTLTEPAILSVSSVSVSNLLCFGTNAGAASINLIGGTTPYRFDIGTGSQTQNTFSNLSANGYIATISDFNNCTITQPFTVSSPSLLSLHLDSIKSARCANTCTGYLQTSVSGGVSPYSFEWSNTTFNPTLTNLCAGAYSVTLTDVNGCQTKDTFEISSPPPLQVTTLADTIFCPEDTTSVLQLQISGGVLPYSILWDTSSILWNTSSVPVYISFIHKNTFSVLVNDSFGCEYTTSGLWVRTPVLQVFFSILQDTSSTHKILSSNMSGGTPPYQYLWSNGSTQSFVPNLTNGWYYVTITDAKGCILTDSFRYFVTNILETFDDTPQLSVYPNPNKGDFTVETNHEFEPTTRFYLLDALGRKLQLSNVELSERKANIWGLNLPSAVYTLIVQTNERLLSTPLIILSE